MLQTINLNPAPVVAAGQTAVFDLNHLVGNTIEGINLTLGGTTFLKSHITGLRIKANAKTVFESDGTKIDLLEQFKGYPADTNTLFINFMEVKARTEKTFTSGSWLTDAASGLVNLKLEVDISASAVAPTLGGWAEISAGVVYPNEIDTAYLMHRRHKATFPVLGAGKVAINVPHLDPSSGGSLFKRIAIFCNNATNLQLIKSGVTQFDGTIAQLAAMQKKAGRVPQSGMVVWDALLDNIAGRQLLNSTPKVVTSAQLFITFSGSETAYIETEELLPYAAY